MKFNEFKKFILTHESLTAGEVALYLPELDDLYSIYSAARKQRSVAILEFGSGWSTLALAKALKENFDSFGNNYLAEIRHPNPFKLMSVDCSKTFQKLAIERLGSDLRSLVVPVQSSAYLAEYQGAIVSFYENLPQFTADFIYLDGPDCDQVGGSIRGFDLHFGSINHTYGLPMAADLVPLEAFLWSGTTIYTDGRGANAQFLKRQFKRNWKYHYDAKIDQHILKLREKPWGNITSRHNLIKHPFKYWLFKLFSRILLTRKITPAIENPYL